MTVSSNSLSMLLNKIIKILTFDTKRYLVVFGKHLGYCVKNMIYFSEIENRIQFTQPCTFKSDVLSFTWRQMTTNDK